MLKLNFKPVAGAYDFADGGNVAGCYDGGKVAGGTVAESSNKVDDKSGTEVAEKEADLDDLLDDLL